MLTANNHALELMAEMEQTLAQGRPFGMAFVRGTCTALSVNIYKMILHLQEMADEKYADLNDAFKTITDALEEILRKRPLSPGGGVAVAHGQCRSPASRYGGREDGQPGRDP